jgi:hypothetical protein
MNLDRIKQKLAALNNNGAGDREKVDYEKVFWKPGVGKHQIRILPSHYNPEFPFTELKFHYGIGKYPMIALSNFSKQDPIEEFIKELRKTSDKDNWTLAGKLTPKTRIFAPVIVRGEESHGVRLWGFGKTVYKSLLALAEDEDVGDFTDVLNGFDMVVDITAGNPYQETAIRLKPKSTALSLDTNMVETWLKTQPDPSAVFTQYEYEFIKRQLMKYLDPDAEDAPATPATPATPAAPAAPAAPATAATATAEFTLQTPATVNNMDWAEEDPAPAKKDVVSKFDDLFGA